MKIVVAGSTLYASVIAVLLAEYGNYVTWMDHETIDDHEVSQRFKKQCQSERLIVSDRMPETIDVLILCYSPNEFDRAQQLVTKLTLSNNQKLLIINGSTFGLHGTQKLSAIQPDVEWAYLPDIIQEGNAIHSLLNAKQLVIGIESEQSEIIIKELLRPLFNGAHNYLFMPILDAELAKLSISGMLATRISYMNDIALMAEKLGVDIINVKNGMTSDNRIGSTYLSPGMGFGGEHFSHDILTLSGEVSKTGAKSRLLEQVWQINEDQKEILFRKLWDYFQSNLSGKVIAIWGAAFKENTSSVHNSPIHVMLKALWAQGVIVQLHDPEALDEMREIYGERADLIYCKDQYDAVKNAEALCLVTAWKQYFSPDYVKLLQLMKHPLLLDGRNIYQPDYIKSLGFDYEGIGRK